MNKEIEIKETISKTKIIQNVGNCTRRAIMIGDRETGKSTLMRLIGAVQFQPKKFIIGDHRRRNARIDSEKEEEELNDYSAAFIIIPYENRFIKMVQQFIINDFKIDERKVDEKVVMISFWDFSAEPKEEFEAIKEIFDQYCKKIICYSKFSSGDEIKRLMAECAGGNLDQIIDVSNPIVIQNENNDQENQVNPKRGFWSQIKAFLSRICNWLSTLC